MIIRPLSVAEVAKIPNREITNGWCWQDCRVSTIFTKYIGLAGSAVYTNMTAHANREGLVKDRSVPAIANELRIAQNTVRAALRVLQEYGLVVSIDNGRGVAPSYRLPTVDLLLKTMARSSKSEGEKRQKQASKTEGATSKSEGETTATIEVPKKGRLGRSNASKPVVSAEAQKDVPKGDHVLYSGTDLVESDHDQSLIDQSPLESNIEHDSPSLCASLQVLAGASDLVPEVPTQESAPKPQPKPTKQRKRDLVFDEMIEQCNYDLRIISAPDRGKVNQTCRILRSEMGLSNEALVEGIRAVGFYWRVTDWRGKEGQQLTPSLIRKLWAVANKPVDTTPRQLAQPVETSQKDGLPYDQYDRPMRSHQGKPIRYLDSGEIAVGFQRYPRGTAVATLIGDPPYKKPTKEELQAAEEIYVTAMAEAQVEKQRRAAIANECNQKRRAQAEKEGRFFL